MCGIAALPGLVVGTVFDSTCSQGACQVLVAESSEPLTGDFHRINCVRVTVHFTLTSPIQGTTSREMLMEALTACVVPNNAELGPLVSSIPAT